MKSISKFYHASPFDNLDQIGIDPNAKPHVSGQRQEWAYLGSLDYIFRQYLRCAKTGIYYIYWVKAEGLNLDCNLAGDQVRTQDYIDSSRVILKMAVKNVEKIIPDCENYLSWWQSRQKSIK